MTIFLRNVYALAAILAMLWAASFTANTARADVFTNVSEASSYGLVYTLEIPDTAGFRDGTSIPYSVDNSATAGTYSRIAYYLELDTGTGLEYVYVSMDAFDTDASRIGLPHNVDNPVDRQQIVDNMNVYSNRSDIVTGTGIATGNIEMWPSNYGPSTTGLIPTGNGSDFDWNDSGGSTSAGHGSFQIHNYGANSTGQVLFGYSDWGGNSSTAYTELGIGTNTGTLQTPSGTVSVGGNPDWTFANSTNYYTIKNLQILVGNPLTWNGGGGATGPVDGSGTWDAVTTNWWDGASTAWTDGDNPIFGAGTGTAGTVTVSGTVKPDSITFSQTGGGNYTITGGTIDFDGNEAMIRTDVDATIDSTLTNGGILKLGDAVLTLGGTNTYAGDVTVQAGTLKLGSNDALGTTAGKTVIQSGATLDIAGFRAGSATPGEEPIEVSGTGVGGNGALINSGGTQTQAFRDVTLLGDTTFGGTGRWDFRYGTLAVGGHKVTKVGGNTVSIVGATVTDPGDVDINAGTFRLEGSTNYNAATAKTIQIASGARLDFWGSNITHNQNMVLNGGTLSANSTSSPSLSGAVTLNANSTIGVGNEYGSPTLTIDGQVTGAGGFTLNARNTTHNTTGTLVLANAANNYNGTTFLNSGTLKFAASSGNTLTRLYVGNSGSTGAAVIQEGGTVSISPTLGSTNVLSLGLNGGYGYYQMNGGSLTVGQLAAGSGSGGNNVGVFDMNDGTVDVTGSGGWLLAGGWTANSKGSFNLFGGTMTGPASNAVTLNVFGNSSHGMINMLGSTAVLDATAHSNGLEVMRATAASSIVNLNAGTLIASKVQQSGTGSAQFNFNGGTLQAGAANVTMALNTGGSAIVYSGGANIDTPGTTTMTINEPLLAPTGYGATSVAVTDGGAGYVGAPFVVLSGGSGYGASAIAQVDQATRQVTGILVTSPGTGYASGDVLTATLFGGGALTPATVGAVTLGANTGGGLNKTGSGTLNLAGTNNYSGTTNVNAGTLVFTTSSNNTIGGINVNGGAAGAELRIEGTTNTGSSDMYVANSTADRSTVVISADTTMHKILVGNRGAGAVIQNSGTVTVTPGLVGQDVLSLGLNGGYGYYQMNGGSLTVGQLAAGSGAGSNNVGVFDMTGGTVSVDGAWLLAGGWRENHKGSINLYGGTMTGPTGNPVTLNVFGRNSYGMLNMLGDATLNANTNSGGLNILRESPNISSIVNLNDGTIVASRVQQSGAGSAQFNFNGGTLQAGATNVTMELQGGGGTALVYSGGANIDTPTSTTMTISQPLLAPTGYGATSVAVTDGGAGYVGAPYVVLSGGSGVGASAVAQVDLATGQLTNILVTSPGSGYASGDVLTATLYGGGATTAATIGTVTLGANTSGGLTKTGAGTLVLSGANTYTGTTTVDAGLLRLNGSTSTTVNAVAGDILIDGGELQWAASHQIADGASIVLDSGKLWMTSAETVANVTINAAASSDFHLINGLNAADTLTISAGNVVVGSGGNAQANAVNMSGGVLAVAANGGSSTFTIGAGGLTMSGAEVRFGYAGTGAGLTARYNLNGDFTGSGTNRLTTPTAAGPRQLDLGGATRTFNVVDGTTTIDAAIQNGGLTKTGAGTLLLNATNVYTGDTMVDEGVFGGNGTLASALTINSGTLAPGTSPGILTLAGGVTFNGGTFAIELNGTTVGSEYDQLLVTGGDVDLGLGVADLAISTTGYSPSPSDLFWIINNTSTTSGLTTGYFQDLAYEGSSLMVDGRRFYIYYEADFETGLFSGGNDVLLTSVPEPSTLALIGTGLLGLALVACRRRKRTA